MKIGILCKSNKLNEKRYPLYWKHLLSFDQKEIDKLYFEYDYPMISKLEDKFNINLLPRKEIFKNCDMIILPKPENVDLLMMKENQILWGWPHTVQGFNITNHAIEKKLTLVAWENMYNWKDDVKKEHIFSRNNELAGYASVNHFMGLTGITPGVYGEDLKIAILGFGSTAKGAINALIGLGATDITVFSKRNRFQIVDAIKNVKYDVYNIQNGVPYINCIKASKVLMGYDLILNCILQDPLHPLVFINEVDLNKRLNKLKIIDISCDRGMGFDFARPTSFDSPITETENYIYYSVDHTPSFYWNAASYEISGALVPFLKYFIENDTFLGNEVLEKAVDILNGKILNNKILSFQNRENEYPYNIIK